jgi:hypothetical protein
MSVPESLFFKDPETGEEYTILFASADGESTVPDRSNRSEDGRGRRGGDDDNPSFVEAKLKEAHKQLRGYALFCIGAFRQFSTANVEEMTVKFNVKIGGQSGIPFLVRGSMDYDFGIEVKCKFPDKPTPPPK